MFTGIVQTLAKVLSINNLDNAQKLIVCVGDNDGRHLELGASIAINGVCLTVVSFTQPIDKTVEISFDVIDETLRVTNLGLLKRGAKVNFERSLKMGDELGGHIVSGHIHCQAKLFKRLDSKNNCQLIFKLCSNIDNDKTTKKAEWLEYIFEKGFITINGTSLTVGKIEDTTFSVHLIPETLARTNLGSLKEGDLVNIECDQQTITIVNTIKRMKLNGHFE